MDDAALLRAVEWAMFGTFWTNGQICSATSRLLVQDSLLPRVLAFFERECPNIKVGHPLDPSTKLGPLVSAAQLDKVLRYIRAGVSHGAKLVTGGPLPTSAPEELRAGNYVLPTVLLVPPHLRDATVWREEIFGPVLCVTPFTTEADAVRIANDSTFGLAAAVFSSDAGKLARVTRVCFCFCLLSVFCKCCCLLLLLCVHPAQTATWLMLLFWLSPPIATRVCRTWTWASCGKTPASRVLCSCHGAAPNTPGLVGTTAHTVSRLTLSRSKL